MNYWVYNITEDHSILNKQLGKASIGQIEVIDKSPTFPAKVDDLFVTLNKNGEFFFDFYGKVMSKPQTVQTSLTSKEVAILEKNNVAKSKYPKKYLHKISVEINKIDQKLDDFMFSLKTVENYSNPYNHFKRKYTSFNLEDFETIVKKMLYLTRTTFGRLFNSLPKENQIEVLLALIEENRTEDIKKIGLLNAIRFLRQYIEDIIIDTGKYIVAIEKLAIELSTKTDLDAAKIGFISVDDNSPRKSIDINDILPVDFLQDQANCFKEFFALDFNLSIIDELELQIKENRESEERFEKIFASKRWPIKITI